MSAPRPRGATLQDVVRACVTLLFGRFRSFGGLTAEETKALQAERREYAERVLHYIRALPAPVESVAQEVRAVTQRFQGDQRADKMPTPEQFAGAVKDAFADRPAAIPCQGCRDMGGWYSHASPGAVLHPRAVGALPWPKGLYLCTAHHEAALFYFARADRQRAGFAWHYPPPACMAPKGWFTKPPHKRPDLSAWIDGASLSLMARWARRFVQEHTDIELPEVGESLPLPEPKAEAPTEYDPV